MKRTIDFDDCLFADRMQHLRMCELGMTMYEFGQEAGLSGASIGNYESMRNGATVYALYCICKTYGVSADWLLGLRDGRPWANYEQRR